jgi:hypothetical protein
MQRKASSGARAGVRGLHQDRHPGAQAGPFSPLDKRAAVLTFLHGTQMDRSLRRDDDD